MRKFLTLAGIHTPIARNVTTAVSRAENTLAKSCTHFATGRDSRTLAFANSHN